MERGLNRICCGKVLLGDDSVLSGSSLMEQGTLGGADGLQAAQVRPGNDEWLANAVGWTTSKMYTGGGE